MTKLLQSPFGARRRWLVLAVALLLVAITSRAGLWQMQRAHEREAAQRLLEERARASALNNADLLALMQQADSGGSAETASDPAAELHQRPVQLTGRWVMVHTVWLDNRSMSGKAGFYVVTPLELGSGKAASHETEPWVWVQRGWVARDVRDRQRLPPIDASDGVVQVQGRLAPQLSARFSLGKEEGGAIRQNLGLAQMQALSAGRSLPWVVIQTGDSDDGLQRNWPSPASGADKNRAYAAQWFGMAILITGLTLWFQIIQPWRRR